jgi:superfamily II DNA helicase RecQ
VSSWPTTPSELLAVHGIGPTKAERHGVAILAVLAGHDRPAREESNDTERPSTPTTSAPIVDRPVPTGSGPLHDRLRTWRRETADQRAVPLYRVLTNATIDAMVDLRPTDADGLLAVPGIGPKTVKAHGTALLAMLEGD